jgi:hypothetical protein
MEGILGWVTVVVGVLLDWVVGIWSSSVDGGGLPPQVMDFASVLIRFLLICGSSRDLPLHMVKINWLLYCSPAGVWYNEGLAKRL